MSTFHFSKKRLDSAQFVIRQSFDQFLFFWTVGGKWSIRVGQKDDVALPAGNLQRANQNLSNWKVVATLHLVASEGPKADEEAGVGDGQGSVKIAIGAVTGSASNTTFSQRFAADDLGHGIVAAGDGWAAKRLSRSFLRRCPETHPLPARRERAVLPPVVEAATYPLLPTAPQASVKKNRRH
jgi:hypothetical protein